MRVEVRVPATVANLGPGFDVLAMALQLQNVVVAQAHDGGAVHVELEGGAPPEQQDGDVREPATNLVARAYVATCTHLGVPEERRGVVLRCRNDIPMARGLGSSAAATLGGVLAASALHRATWDSDRILGEVTRLEGHPDNAAAALWGGAVVCAPGAAVQRFDVPDELHALVLVPRVPGATADARRVVPETLNRGDAVFNAARCALLVRSLLLKDYGALRDAMDDRWHQKQRAALYPALRPLIDAAYAGGAAGACLAGAGPSVLALTAVDPDAVAAALRDAAAANAVEGEVLHLRPRNFGSRVDVHA